MRTHHTILTVAICLLILSAAAFAETIPGRWEKIDTLQPGIGIIVKLEGGERFECQFVSSDAESITVRESDNERNLPKSGVRKIVTAEKTGTGPLWTGAVIGAVIGAATAGIILAAVDDGGERNIAGPVLGCAGIGAGIGLGIDAAVGARDTLYVSR